MLKGLTSPCSKVRYYCVYKKEETGAPVSKYIEFGIYSMNKNGGRRKMIITRASAAS